MRGAFVDKKKGEKIDKLKTEYLLNREVDRVLAALMPVNRLVIRVCLHTGLRLGDVLNLRTEQLAPRFWVTEQKTHKRKLVGLPEELLTDLREQAGMVYVFEHSTDPDKHRTRQAVWKDVKRAAKAFRLPQNVAPHSFRKVYAVELLEKYGDIEKVRRNLNHSDINVTMIYAMADQLLRSRFQKKPHHP